MFEANELRLLETAVSNYIGEFEGAVSDEKITAQHRILVKLQRVRWIMERTPMRFKRHGQEHTGTITEFRNWGSIEMVGMHTEEGAYYWVLSTDLIGPV
jgi:hypothetical protein